MLNGGFQIGRDNPAMWRAGGLIMAAFGVAVIAGLVLLAVWHPPAISVTVALAILIAAGVVFDGHARSWTAEPSASQAAGGGGVGMIIGKLAVLNEGMPEAN